MNIGILGSGLVGQELAKGFRDRGDAVRIATRSPEKLDEWRRSEGKGIEVGNAVDTATFGDIIVLAVAWTGVDSILDTVGPETLSGKTVIDVTNPLVFEVEGEPPALGLGYPQSAGSRLQALLPDSKVVKCFNIVNARLMTNPSLAAEKPDMFLTGNDVDAKTTVSLIAEGWGWIAHDLGGIERSYILEAFALLWIVYGFTNNRWEHVFKLMNT